MQKLVININFFLFMNKLKEVTLNRLMEEKDGCWRCFVGISDTGLRKIKIK